MSKNERVVAENNERVSPVVPMFGRELASVAVIGLAVGVITWVAMTLLERYVFAAVMCRENAAANCADAASYATIVAMILGAVAALIALVQARVYRPLLAVIAATAALWGFALALLGGVAWYWALLITAILFGLTYALFAWVARIRSFVLAIVISLVLIVVIRLVLVG